VAVSWFLRAVEQADGRWVCRFGKHEFGAQPNLTLALHLMAEAATQLGGRENFTFYPHHLNGGVEVRPGTAPVPGEGS
jgi:alkyl sulfatase BDS1-like metallo-beta-lactamase superfamily hydrolase